MQQNVHYVIVIIAFVIVDAVYPDAINAIVYHVYVVHPMYVIHAVQYVVALHANAIFEHALHAIIPAIITAKYEYLNYFIFFWIKY